MIEFDPKRTLPNLSRCPFCGGDAHWNYSSGVASGVSCIEMGCRANVSFHTMRSETPEEIANHWNTRFVRVQA